MLALCRAASLESACEGGFGRRRETLLLAEGPVADPLLFQSDDLRLSIVDLLGRAPDLAAD